MEMFTDLLGETRFIYIFMYFLCFLVENYFLRDFFARRNFLTAYWLVFKVGYLVLQWLCRHRGKQWEGIKGYYENRKYGKGNQTRKRA